MYRIFGRTVALELGTTTADRILAEELSIYPAAGADEAADLVIRHVAEIQPARGLNNPATHYRLDDGFAARYDAATVRFRLEDGRLRGIDFCLARPPSGLRRWISRWRNIQFSSPEEAIGQTVHELVLVPSVYFDAERFLLHASAVQAPDSGVVLIGGTGGVGKTSLELELCRGRGYRFLADDIVVGAASGEIWPNLSYPKIYGYNLQDDPGLEATVFGSRGMLDRVHWHWRARRGPARVRRRVDPQALYGAVSREGGRLSRYIILAREQRADIQATTIDADLAAELSVQVMAAEYGKFHQHLYWNAYNGLLASDDGPTIELTSVLSRWKLLAREAFRDAECLLVRVPCGEEHARFRRSVADLVAAVPSAERA